jgi:hypothetical protein
MKKLLIAAAMLAAFIGNANAAVEMPESLFGQWCRTRGTDDHGFYVKAKNFCKETRPLVFQVIKFGFWIKLVNVKTKIMCVPQQIDALDHGWGWRVVADCGADDNSTPIYRMGFTFEDVVTSNDVVITRFKPEITP